jgi:hypothetical protein
MSTKENTILNDELDLSTATVINANVNTVLGPQQYTYFPVQAGRNYNVVASNIDDSFDVTFTVEDGSGGHKNVTIAPGRQVSIPTNGDSGKILAWNTTYPKAPNRPSVFVSLYSA